MGSECSTHNREENAYKVLVGKPEGKRPLGRPEVIKMILKKLRCKQTRFMWLRIGTSDGLL